MSLELERIESQIAEKQVELDILNHQIEQRRFEFEWNGTRQKYVVRQLLAAIQTVLKNPIYRGFHRCAGSYVPQIETVLTRAINDRIDDLIQASRVYFSNRKIDEYARYARLPKESNFPPIPPPLLDANQIIKNGTAVPNESGIYFLWEGPLVAYVGQSINLAHRLFKHPRLRINDKISYLCVDRRELFYHEAFYIGVCRPLRNGRGTRSYDASDFSASTTFSNDA